MKTETYFAVASFPDLSQFLGREIDSVLAELPDLTAAEAMGIQQALVAEYPGRCEIAMVAESAVSSDFARWLGLRTKVKITQDQLAAMTPEQINVDHVSRLAYLTPHFADTARRARPRDEVEVTTRPVAEPFEVMDVDTRRTVVLDPNDIEHWGPAQESEGWESGGYPTWFLEVTLYRHDTGHWTLVTERTHCECDVSGTPEARRLTDTEAVDWLVRHGFSVPTNVAHLAHNSRFKPGPPPPTTVEVNDNDDVIKPRWDPERKELWLGDKLCKRFRQGAENQKSILEAFHSEGWPPRIDNPIPFKSDTDSRARLADAVRQLNNNDHIVFERDGTGEGVLWKPKPAASDGIPF